MQLGRKLRAGGASANDRDLQLFRTQRLGLRVRSDAGVNEATVKAFGLRLALEQNGMLLGPWRAKVVAEAADGNDQGVVSHRLPLGDNETLLVAKRGNMHQPALTVDPAHLTDAVAKTMPVRLSQIIELVHADVHAAGRDFMQQRLPQMRALFFDQRDGGFAASAELVAEPGDKFEPARTTADHDDLVQVCARAIPRPIEIGTFRCCINFTGLRHDDLPLHVRSMPPPASTSWRSVHSQSL